MAGIVNWLSFFTWTPIPSLADDSSCWTRTQRSIVYAKWAADGNGPKKKRRNSRRHRNSVGTRYCGRSHHRTEVDPQDPPEDRRITRTSVCVRAKPWLTTRVEVSGFVKPRRSGRVGAGEAWEFRRDRGG